MDDTPDIFDAVASRDIARVRALIAAHAGLARAKNADTLSVLQFARYGGQDAILDALIAAGPDLDIFEASQLGRTARVASLLDADPALARAYSSDGFTALHFASYYGSAEVVRLLLQRGANIEAVTKNFLKNMPIHAAAAGRHRGICAVLLERGANVNAKQHGGFAPLHAPAQHGDREMVELLLSHGADATVTTDDGKTAADIAASQGNIELAALLRARAATTQVRR